MKISDGVMSITLFGGIAGSRRGLLDGDYRV